MKFILALIVTVGSIHLALAYGVPTTNNPMKYAEKSSLLYAEGDTGDTSGWEGCKVTQLYPQRVQIQCEGSTTILVHGGHRSEKRFECRYNFERRSTNLFNVQNEHCE